MKARLNFSLGHEEYQMATQLENDGAKLSGEKAMRTAGGRGLGLREGAREISAPPLGADPKLKEGWNMLGYTSRKLGDYEESLQAYDKALALAPDYPEAIEYRAELFLLTGRLATGERGLCLAAEVLALVCGRAWRLR